MSLNRYDKRRDANEKEIVLALRCAGAHVFLLDRPVDLLVGYGGVSHLIEVKIEEGGRLTTPQRDFIKRWTGKGGDVHVVRTVDEALAAIGAKT